MLAGIAAFYAIVNTPEEYLLLDISVNGQSAETRWAAVACLSYG
jgi:hypothetical protein